MVRYLRFRDPIGFKVHLILGCIALSLAPLWHAPSAVAFGILAGYCLIRLPNTWRAYSAVLAEPAIVAWILFGTLLATSVLWCPFGCGLGLDHLRAWRVMLYPLLLLPVLPNHKALAASLVVGCVAQLALMLLTGEGRQGLEGMGPLRNVNLTGMWGAVLATAGIAAVGFGRAWGVVMLCVGITTSLLSQSRGSLVSLGVGSITVIMSCALRGPVHERWRRTGRACLVLLAATLVGLAILPTAANRLRSGLSTAAQRVTTIGDLRTIATSVDAERFLLWRFAATKAMDRPVVGWGFGSYPTMTTAVIDTFDRTWWSQPDDAASLSSIGRHRGSHSMYLRVACEQGLVGVAVLLAAVALTFKQLASLARTSGSAVAGLGILMAWLVYAATEDAHTMTRALLPVPMVLTLVLLGDRLQTRNPS